MKRKRPSKRAELFYLRPETPGYRFRLKLKELLTESGLSAENFAKEHGWNDRVLSYTKLRAYLAGWDVPDIDALVRMARTFRVSIAYLADDEVDDRGAHFSAASLPPTERTLVEKGRQLGLERAALVVDMVEKMGYEQFIGLVAAAAASAASGGGHGAQGGQNVGGNNIDVVGGDNHQRQKPRGDQATGQGHPRKPRK